MGVLEKMGLIANTTTNYNTTTNFLRSLKYYFTYRIMQLHHNEILKFCKNIF